MFEKWYKNYDFRILCLITAVYFSIALVPYVFENFSIPRNQLRERHFVADLCTATCARTLRAPNSPLPRVGKTDVRIQRREHEGLKRAKPTPSHLESNLKRSNQFSL